MWNILNNPKIYFLVKKHWGKLTDSVLHDDGFFFIFCVLDRKLAVLLWAVFFWPLSFPFYASIHLTARVVRAAAPRFGKEQGNTVIYHARICCPNPISLMGTFKKATYLKAPRGDAAARNILTECN